jgi:hypothetical protein
MTGINPGMRTASLATRAASLGTTGVNLATTAASLARTMVSLAIATVVLGTRGVIRKAFETRLGMSSGIARPLIRPKN